MVVVLEVGKLVGKNGGISMDNNIFSNNSLPLLYNRFVINSLNNDILCSKLSLIALDGFGCGPNGTGVGVEGGLLASLSSSTSFWSMVMKRSVSSPIRSNKVFLDVKERVLPFSNFTIQCRGTIEEKKELAD